MREVIFRSRSRERGKHERGVGLEGGLEREGNTSELRV